MKKKIYFGIVTFIIAIAGTTQVLNSSNSEFDSFFASNVDALTQDVDGTNPGLARVKCDGSYKTCYFRFICGREYGVRSGSAKLGKLVIIHCVCYCGSQLR